MKRKPQTDDRLLDIRSEALRRVLVLDGAMGTMIQRRGLSEADFRGERFAAHPCNLRGCNDLLCLTRPDVITGIHEAYLAAGSDIIETNTFNANAISLAEYGLADEVEAINRAGARLAREAVERHREATGRQAWVAGSMGPGNISLSMPVGPGESRAVDFSGMAEAMCQQAKALIAGGVDVILLETIFDTLNAKASIYGVKEAIRLSGRRVPLMISVTLTPQGRTLSGQTIEAFLASISHARPLSVGLNCGFGAREMRRWLEAMQPAPWLVSLHPNAGLPDEMGRYCESPGEMARVLRDYLDRGWLNIVGGCCGTTPGHIAAIAREAAESIPRTVPECDTVMRLSGLQLLEVQESEFIKVGERCNVAGSRKFLRLVEQGALGDALAIAASQTAKGASILDVNMDDGMLDSANEMERFVTMLGLDGTTAPVPVMIDSSDFEVISRALRQMQGRGVVNSISLNEGEEAFLRHAREIRRLGAAVIVMAFDEVGQADTLQRRIDICRRAYNLLTREAGFEGKDIIFDPNILTIATGIPEHDRYALDFLEATEWIKRNLPGARVSGGVSNLSFAFRGNNPLREAMHTVFLHHARLRGMDMAIINPSASLEIETVESDLREAIEDVIFMRRPDATARLTGIATKMAEAGAAAKQGKGLPRTGSVKGAVATVEPVSLADMVVAGHSENLEMCLEEAIRREGSAMAVIKGHLMEGMNRVGEAFGEGRMFLPQVVRSAGVMKQAIAWLTPYIERESGGDTSVAHTADGGVIVLATVKGDVHDIGKNIVAVVLRCSGFEVVDLGVMVPASRIIEEVRSRGARFVGLSGLITPSLAEMTEVARTLEREGMSDVTLFVGGATTSSLHTAVKIAPEFSGSVFHTRDAATLPDVAARLRDTATRDETVRANREMQARLREEYAAKSRETKGCLVETRPAAPSVSPMPAPRVVGTTDYDVDIADVAPLINWKAFRAVWRVPQDDVTGEAEKLRADAEALVEELREKGVKIRTRAVLVPARREDLDIVLTGTSGREIRVPTMRQESGRRLSAADFLAPADDWVALFVVTVGRDFESLVEAEDDDYRKLMLQALGDRLVEGATEWLHERVHNDLWGLADRKRGPRPAIGYPSLPDQTITQVVDPLLRYSDLGVEVTENGALYPSSTTTGFIFASPEARYFDLGPQSPDALADYARRRGLTAERLASILPRH